MNDIDLAKELLLIWDIFEEIYCQPDKHSNSTRNTIDQNQVRLRNLIKDKTDEQRILETTVQNLFDKRITEELNNKKNSRKNEEILMSDPGLYK
jgi:hypothetical protein